MIPSAAVIRSPQFSGANTYKIGGLYLLERNIMVLLKAGITRIFLDLSDDERAFYEKKIRKRLPGKGTPSLIKEGAGSGDRNTLRIKSNQFLQPHYFEKDDYFQKSGDGIVPMKRDDQFEIRSVSDRKKALFLVTDYIVKNTGGFLAQKVNKRISIPISSFLSRTRVHPNYLTFFNMVVGFFSSVFVYWSAVGFPAPRMGYLFMALGGLFFQLSSVLDGVDGEVAKLNFRVSKFGGWLDTFSDNSTLLLFLVAASYLNFRVMGGCLSLLSIIGLFIGLGVMMYVLVSYLVRFSNSGSLVAYDREFLQKLPESDMLVRFTLRMKYFTKKEFFSLLFFLIALTGKLFIIIPGTAIVLIITSIILLVLNYRYAGMITRER